jgi:hypothetical protein
MLNIAKLHGGDHSQQRHIIWRKFTDVLEEHPNNGSFQCVLEMPNFYQTCIEIDII